MNLNVSIPVRNAVPSSEVRNPVPADLDQRVAAFKAKYATISDAEHDRIANLEQHFDDADQTTNPEWLEARRHRLTGSITGTIVHQNPYESWSKLLMKKLHQPPMDARGREACQYGNLNEPNASMCFEAYLLCYCLDKPWDGDLLLRDFSLREYGLLISKERPCLGMSPDGILEVLLERPDKTTFWRRELVEYKCPYSFPRLLRNQQERGDDNMYPPKMVPAPLPANTLFTKGDAALRETQLVHVKIRGGLKFNGVVESISGSRCSVLHRAKKDGDAAGTTVPRVQLRDFKALSSPPTCVVTNVPLTYVRPFPPVDRAPQKLAVPPYYFSQIQYGMRLLDLPRCHFVVWSPSKSQHLVVPRDHAYGDYVFNACVRFWENEYVPRAVLHECGCFLPGETDVPVEV